MFVDLDKALDGGKAKNTESEISKGLLYTLVR